MQSENNRTDSVGKGVESDTIKKEKELEKPVQGPSLSGFSSVNQNWNKRSVFNFTTISCIDKFSIISKMICKYAHLDDVVSAVSITRSLIETMDELSFFNVSLDDLYHEYAAEHLEKRALFLEIVTQNWPKILEEFKLNDCESSYVFVPNEEEIPLNPPTIYSTRNMLEEVDCVWNIIEKNRDQKIYVVADDENFATLLGEKLIIQKIKFETYLSIEEFDLNEIIQKFNCANINQAKKIANILPKYNKQGSDLSIISSKSIGDLVHEEAQNNPQKKDKELEKPIQGPLPIGFSSIDQNWAKGIEPRSVPNFMTTDIIIFTCMTDKQYDSSFSNSYWLQDSVRKKLGLPTLKYYKKIAENNFFKALNSAQVFVTFSKKIDGVLASMSNVLRKIQLNFHGCHVNFYEKSCSNSREKSGDNCPKVQINSIKLSEKHIPLELSLRDIELLLNDPCSFYIRDSLDIWPGTHSTKDKNNRILRKLYDDLIESVPNNTEEILQNIANYDFYKFQHCRNIMKWLSQWPNANNALTNIYGEAFLHITENNKILIKGKIDILVDDTLINYRIFRKKITASSVLNGENCAPLVLCLLARLGAFNNQKIDIKEIQIWDMDGIGSEPVKVNSIQISNETIDYFEKRLRDCLEDYILNQNSFTTNDNKYRHYKRI